MTLLYFRVPSILVIVGANLLQYLLYETFLLKVMHLTEVHSLETVLTTPVLGSKGPHALAMILVFSS